VDDDDANSWRDESVRHTETVRSTFPRGLPQDQRASASGSSRRSTIRGVIAVTLGLIFLPAYLRAEPLLITRLDRAGTLAWTNATVPGVCSVEAAKTLNGSWEPLRNAFSTTPAGSIADVLDATRHFYRLRTVEVSPTATGFTNLIRCYGVLETVAGDGVGRADGVSYWQPQFEGGPAAYASLSRPHYAMADRAGNIYIADKNSHSVLRVDPQGLIHTHAGTHLQGFNSEGPAPATAVQLSVPNGLWVRADGTVYVLDTGNGRVRRVDTNGILTTLFLTKTDGSALDGGRCLWVRDDEKLAYFGNTDRLRQWTPSHGLETFASNFVELGTFFVEPSRQVIVADRGALLVYRVLSDGSRTILAGNGSTQGGGDGAPALSTGFNGPRGVWSVPTGGYLLLLHDGAQLWYLDAANTARLLLNGAGGNGFVHGGEERYFYAPAEPRIGEGRSVSLDYTGNIIICESDYGFIRRIRFQRMQP
jgi:hypothetical protein